MKQIAVIGAGTMGHGIAQVAAVAGYAVCLTDARPETLAPALDKVRANLAGAVKREKLSATAADAALGQLRTANSVAEAVKDADMVIEAVIEDLSIKCDLFAAIAAAAPDHATLATNTSSLSVTAIAAGSGTPARVVGMHFFNPVHIMTLVEVVWGPETSDATRDAAVAFARRLGKEPIVVKDVPGFASSRLGIVLGMEAIRMVEQGVASPQDIDRAMELGYRHPMGPLRLTDLVGLDVRLGIAEYLRKTLGSDAFEPPALLRRMVAEGKLGKKSGHGFYDW